MTNQTNQKLIVINLNLGIPVTTEDEIHPKTKENIHTRITTIQKEKQLIKKHIKEENDLAIAAQQCFNLLLHSTNKTPASKLLEESKTTNLSALTQAINRYIKDNYKDTIQLNKNKIKGKTHYYLKVN